MGAKILLLLVTLVFMSSCAIPLNNPDVIVHNTTSGKLNYAALGLENVPYGDSAKLPTSEYIDTLSPQTIRNSIENADLASFRVGQMGATHQISLKDGFDVSQGVYPGDSESWTLWESYIDEALGETFSYQIVIWDKPDTTWSHSMSQFYDMWEYTYNKIKSENPGAVLIGPSLSTFDEDQMFAFILEAKKRNVVPDIIAWHGVDDVVDNVERVREFLDDQGLARFMGISTYGSEQDSLQKVLGDIKNIENANVYSSVRSCEGDCTMSGLLAQEERTSLWWFYKAYADLRGDMINYTGTLPLLGTTDGAGFYMIVGSQEKEIVLRFDDIRKEPSVSLYHVTGNGPEALAFDSLFEKKTFHMGWKNIDSEGVYLVRVLR